MIVLELLWLEWSVWFLVISGSSCSWTLIPIISFVLVLLTLIYKFRTRLFFWKLCWPFSQSKVLDRRLFIQSWISSFEKIYIIVRCFILIRIFRGSFFVPEMISDQDFSILIRLIFRLLMLCQSSPSFSPFTQLSWILRLLFGSDFTWYWMWFPSRNFWQN